MEFNNNNYLPAFPGSVVGPAMSTQAYAQTPSSSQYAGPVHCGFTFTSPTQCNTPSTPRSSIQAFSPMCNMTAPGVGANWQHSVPSTRQRITRSSPPPQSRLGMPSNLPGFSQQRFFIPKDGSLRKTKVKRKAAEDPEGAPSCKVHLCLDKLKKLHISPKKKEQYENSSNNSRWTHFHEVENRLEEDLDLEVTEMSLEHKEDKEKGPVIRIADGVIPKEKSESLLPRQVIEDVQKSCMQLILWQSPAATIRDVLDGKGLSASQSSGQPCQTVSQTSNTLQESSSKSSSLESMDVQSEVDLQLHNFSKNSMNGCTILPSTNSSQSPLQNERQNSSNQNTLPVSLNLDNPDISSMEMQSSYL